MKILASFIISLSLFILLLFTVKLLDNYNFYTVILPLTSIVLGIVLINIKRTKKAGIGFLLALVVVYIFIISIFSMLGSMGC